MENWSYISQEEGNDCCSSKNQDKMIVFYYTIIKNKFEYFKEKPDCKERFIKDITGWSSVAYTHVEMGYNLIDKELYNSKPESWTEGVKN